MTVKAILDAKGGSVITIEPTASLEQAAKILAERRIGALVVTGPEQRIVGIVSERDVVAMLAARGCHALDVPLTAAMAPIARCGYSDYAVVDKVFSIPRMQPPLPKQSAAE